MKLNTSIRVKIFLITVVIVVVGQVLYSISNVKFFQEIYLETLQVKSQKLGGYLKREIEYILKLGIPLEKLVEMERTLKQTLTAIPEIEFIELVDTKGSVLYYADHLRMMNRKPGERNSLTRDEKANLKIEKLGFEMADIDITLPVHNEEQNRMDGRIIIRLNADAVVEKSNNILFDMITIILISLLITFELMTFFIAFTISNPVRKVAGEVKTSIDYLSPIPVAAIIVVRELQNIVDRVNIYLQQFIRTVTPFFFLKNFFPQLQKKMEPSLNKQVDDIDDILSRPLANTSNLKPAGELTDVLTRMRQNMLLFKHSLHTFSNKLSTPLAITVCAGPVPDTELLETKKSIPSAYIRPLIFLFAMASSFSSSFFPMFVDTFYQPLWGLSKEVVIGLPISLYMLFLAISMPFAGKLSDSYGWKKPLLAGILISAVGHVLTAVSQTMLHIFVSRCIAAVGLGAVLMSCQRFVISHTSVKSRALGMASYSAAFFTGSLCGVVIGGLLADRIGYDKVFFLGAVFAFAAFCFGIIVLNSDEDRSEKKTEKKKEKPKKNASYWKDVYRLTKNREFFAVVFLQAIPAKIALIGFLTYLVPLYLKHMGTLQSDISRVVMTYGLIMAFLGPAFPRIFKNASSRKYLILAGGIITGGAMVMNHFFTGFWVVLFMVMMLGVGQAVSNSAQVSYISEIPLVKSVGAGTGIGLFRFWERIGNISGPLLMGYLIARGGYEYSVTILGLISIGSGLVYALMVCDWKKAFGLSTAAKETE